jgi:hypothetical protein
MLSPTCINEKNNICVYIEGKKTGHPTWQAMGTPKSSSLPEFQWREFHLHTIGFELPGRRRVYTSEWPSPCTQPLLTYCQKHAKAVSTTSSWENIKVV